MSQIHTFSTRNSGIKKKLLRSSSILDYFELFFSEELVQYIADEINDYRAQKSNNNLNTSTTVDQLYCFSALSLLMTRNRKVTIQEYWSKDKCLRSSIFAEIMTRDRLMLYKGRLSFRQYIPSKRNRFGIKSFMLCDCKTVYVQDVIVYCGRSTTIESATKGIGKSGTIVLSLLLPFLGNGHKIYLDNFYSSPGLFNMLHNNSTNACGTISKRRQGMSKFEKHLKKGEACFRSSNSLLAIKWLDEKEVYMITTVHTADFAAVPRCGGLQSVATLVCVIDYNKSMGTIDKVDMVISTVNTTRKLLKWYFFEANFFSTC
ncbi:piggyBac transposable element-derived protein 4-like [Vespula squamosa]|uniref:PiggyBac transposable element-derived protein 4-like n=1 Tax=Vespula squamosa TaxID=30214 RepID=A0ABD2BG89_VESSQ